MTEKDLEIQTLRAENLKLRKQIEELKVNEQSYIDIIAKLLIDSVIDSTKGLNQK
jgi:cell division protein FtsB